jgi:Xaa-Pro aminopeptidase
MTLAQERRQRLVAAMAGEGIGHLLLYGNAWQGDYLRYGAGFGILEGHGIALMTAADGSAELLLDSAAEADRAEREAPDVTVSFAADIARGVGARLAGLGETKIGAAPRRFLPRWLTRAERGFTLTDATALVDKLLMHKSAGEIAAIRRAADIADDAYGVFRSAVRPGRRQYEVVADIEAHLRSVGCPDNFMIIGSGGKDVLGMAPPSERRIAVGDLVTTELTPAVDGYIAQICRTPQRRAFAVYAEALEAGIAAVRPGVRAADVARAENDVFRKYGLGEYTTNKWTRVRGHGMGLFADSKPHILEDVNTVLEPGMALIVHPNTYHPDAGYIVLGDAIVVTENGADVLCRTPRELFEVQV